MNRVKISAPHGGPSLANVAWSCQVAAGSLASASSWAARTSASVDWGHIPPEVADANGVTASPDPATASSFGSALRHTMPKGSTNSSVAVLSSRMKLASSTWGGGPRPGVVPSSQVSSGWAKTSLPSVSSRPMPIIVAGAPEQAVAKASR